MSRAKQSSTLVEVFASHEPSSLPEDARRLDREAYAIRQVKLAMKRVLATLADNVTKAHSLEHCLEFPRVLWAPMDETAATRALVVEKLNKKLRQELDVTYGFIRKLEQSKTKITALMTTSSVV